jgi:BirA family biotin operon repressor/biotin-[acetyl-CoA-carboxylase] ligase
LKNTPNFYGVASLKKYQRDTPLVVFVQTFLEELEKILELLNAGQIKKIIKDWTRRSSTIGKIVKLTTNEGEKSGKAIKIDDDGALVIFNKKNSRVLAGDITHLKN